MVVCRCSQLPRRHRMFRVMALSFEWFRAGCALRPFRAKRHGAFVSALCRWFEMLSVLSSIKRRSQLFPFQQVECSLKGNMRPNTGVLMAKDIPKHTRLDCRFGIKPACFSFLLKKAGVYGGKWIQQSRAIFTKSRPWLLRFCGCIRFHVEATPLSRETMGYACPLAQGKARVWLHLQCPGIPFYFKKARRTVSGSPGPSLFYGHLLSRKGCGTAMFQPGCAVKHASYFHAQHMLPRFTRKEGMRTTRHAAGRHWRFLWRRLRLCASCAAPAPYSNALQAHRAKAIAASCFKCRKHSGRRKARVFICGDHRIRLFYERCIIGPAQQHCNKRNPAFRKLRKKCLLPA